MITENKVETTLLDLGFKVQGFRAYGFMFLQRCPGLCIMGMPNVYTYMCVCNNLICGFSVALGLWESWFGA